jgi:hypothetical protein
MLALLVHQSPESERLAAVLVPASLPLILGLFQGGFTPLHMAVIGKKEAVISHLLIKGANPHLRDRVTDTKFCHLFFYRSVSNWH